MRPRPRARIWFWKTNRWLLLESWGAWEEVEEAKEEAREAAATAAGPEGAGVPRVGREGVAKEADSGVAEVERIGNTTRR